MVIIKNGKNFRLQPNPIVELNDETVFSLGEMFPTFEEFEKRLENHSKTSLVRYARRDRCINNQSNASTTSDTENQVFYSIKYTCIYGDQKSMRSMSLTNVNCPAHILIKVRKTGKNLVVVSVCNRHNHKISPELYRKLPQHRRISKALKSEVLKLLQSGTEKSEIIEFIRSKTGKSFFYKDLLDIIAKANHNNHTESSDDTMEFEEEKEETEIVISDDEDNQQQPTDPTKQDVKAPEPTEDVLLVDNNVIFNEDLKQLYENSFSTIGGEVEIFHNEANNDNNIIQFLCQPSSTQYNEDSSQCESVIIDDTQQEGGNEGQSSDNVLYLQMVDQDGRNTDSNIYIVPNDIKYCLREDDMDESETLPIYQNVMFTQPGEAVPSELPALPNSPSCVSCGRDVKAAEKHVTLLKEEKSKLLKETMALTVMRDRLRMEIDFETNKLHSLKGSKHWKTH